MCRSEACPLPVATVLSADMPFPRPRAQPMKPKLPRKFAHSARINLNKYWHALEELMPVSCRALDESDSNAINENLDNERRLAAMRLSELQVGNPGPSNPTVCNFTSGKKTFLNISTSNVHQNSSEPSMKTVDSARLGAESCFPQDENTPPVNGSVIAKPSH